MKANYPKNGIPVGNYPNSSMPPQDPFGSMQGFMQQYQSFMQNPAQVVSQKLGVQGNDPSQMIQQLMNSGKMSQNDYNKLNEMARRIQQNPMFAQMFGRR